MVWWCQEDWQLPAEGFELRLDVAVADTEDDEGMFEMSETAGSDDGGQSGVVTDWLTHDDDDDDAHSG